MSKSVRMRRIFSLIAIGLLAAVLALSTVGCKKIEPITSADFEAAATDLGYEVDDITSSYSGAYYQINKCIGFEIEESGVHVEFFECGDESDAVSFFNENKQIVENFGNSTAETNVSMSTHSKYTRNNGDKYYVVEQVGATAIYAFCPSDAKGTLDDFLSIINY